MNLTVRFNASEESGIARASVGLQGSAHTPILTGECMPIDNPIAFECTLHVPESQPRGEYQMSIVAAEDRTGYLAMLSSGHPAFAAVPSLWVESDVADDQAPQLVGIDLPDLPVPRGSSFGVQIRAHGDSPLQGAVLRMQTVHGNAETDTTECPTNAPGVLTCKGLIPARFPLGSARLHFAWMTDVQGNAAHYFRPGTLGCPNCFWVTPDANNDTEFLVGPSALEVLDATPCVKALDPFFSEVAPGHILPLVVQSSSNTIGLSFSFVNRTASGVEAVKVARCHPQANLTVIGSLCHLIVPEDAVPGVYSLENVVVALADGKTQVVRLDPTMAPSFTIDPDAQSPTYPLPVAWRSEVHQGVTSEAFNAPGASFAMPILVAAGQLLVAALGDEAHLPEFDVTWPDSIDHDVPAAPAWLLLVVLGVLARRRAT